MIENDVITDPDEQVTQNGHHHRKNPNNSNNVTVSRNNVHNKKQVQRELEPEVKTFEIILNNPTDDITPGVDSLQP